MGIYNPQKPFFDTLLWDDIFPSAEEFETKMKSVLPLSNAKLEPFDELYELLAMRYSGAHTRYTTQYPFILGLKRELIINYPIFIQQKALVEQLMDLDVEELRLKNQLVRNVVDRPTVGIPTNPSLDPIPELSTVQEAVTEKLSILETTREKYMLVNKNYLEQIYRAINPLFKVILQDEEYTLFPQ